MFEDLLGTKKEPKLVAKLEKNGEMVENAVLDVSKYERTYEGYITCPGMTVTQYDDFWLHLMYTKDTDITRRMFKIFVHPESQGRFRFTMDLKTPSVTSWAP